MRKYGDELNVEFARAVKEGQIPEPFTKNDVAHFASYKGWNPSSRYINVLLPNSSSLTHSSTYKKYFVALGDGLYQLSELAKREL